jgi:lipopolysaccharide transport system permease protein
MNKERIHENWDTIIKPKSGWFDFNLREIWHYRDLVALFVRRDFTSLYKQTILGPLLYFIQPLLTTLIYTVIFNIIAHIPTDGNPAILFFLANSVAWSYFANCINKTATTFTSNAGIFGKVYFPRLTAPISVVLSNLITFIIQFLMFLCFLLYYYYRGEHISPNIYILITPVLLLIMAMFGLGIGIIVSSLTNKYRDLQYLLTYGVQLLMYATPVIYPLSIIPDKYKIFILANPMTPVIETFRYAFLGSGIYNIYHLLYSAIFSLIVFIIGIILFSRVEKSFMDTV